MKEGPLNEKELEWLEDTLIKYGNEDSVMDVAELDGLLTAVLSGPTMIEPEVWMVALWGGEKNVPRWTNERELQRFMDLTFRHMNDIADRLHDYPDQFEPLFGVNTIEDQDFTVVEEWCFGYMRGVALDDWSLLPANLQPALEAIKLHGTEENFSRVEKLTPEEFEQSIAAIGPAALELHGHWLSQPIAPSAPVQMPYVAEQQIGRNDPCPCGSGKKYKNCCLH